MERGGAVDLRGESDLHANFEEFEDIDLVVVEH